MKNSRNAIVLLGLLLGLTLPGFAAEAGVNWLTLITQHVERQSGSVPYRVVVDVPTDEVMPPPCLQRPSIAETSRPRWLGPMSLSLACERPAWRGTLTVRVRGMTQVVRSARPLNLGVRISEDDVRLVEADFANEPTGAATELAQVLGRETSRPLRENSTVALNALRVPTVIKIGDRLTVRVSGKAFEISADGVAQQAGAVGENIRVKLSDGRALNAVVMRAGLVVIEL
jgi:flagella basal body P-ring formation protein FlgA